MSFHKFKKQYLDVANVSDAQNTLRVINTLQNNIDDALQPMVVKTQNDSLIIPNISLIAGQVNIVNHRLGRILQCWNCCRIRGPAIIYDDQDNNPSPNLTLWLHTTADVTINLLVS